MVSRLLPTPAPTPVNREINSSGKAEIPSRLCCTREARQMAEGPAACSSAHAQNRSGGGVSLCSSDYQPPQQDCHGLLKTHGVPFIDAKETVIIGH